MKKYEFDRDVWGVGLVLVVSEDHEDFLKELKDRKIDISHTNLEDNLPWSSGVTCGFDDGTPNMYIWLRSLNVNNPEDISVLVHELLHLVLGNLDHKGVSVNKNEQEPMAYTIDYWVRTVLERVKDVDKQAKARKRKKKK